MGTNWGIIMFEEKFNDLVIGINAFIIKTKKTLVFETLEEKIDFYHNLVDNFNFYTLLISELSDEVDKDKYIDIYSSLSDYKEDLNNAFAIIKDNPIIKAYIEDLNNDIVTKGLYSEIYNYERSLVNTPLHKIDIEYIQRVMDVVNNYNIELFEFYKNNPYNVDENVGLVIPEKVECIDKNDFTNKIYNYLLELFNIYKIQNKVLLEELEVQEKNIEELLFETNTILREYNNNKEIYEYGMTAEEYYNVVNTRIDTLNDYISRLINFEIERFYNKYISFEVLQIQIKSLISYYTDNGLYKEFLDKIKFNNLLEELQSILTLIEYGKINIDKNYIVDNINLKDITLEIVKLSSILRQKIYYVENINITGVPILKEFEFYQTADFLESIKKYYYNLVNNTISNSSQLTVYEIGDNTIDNIRNEFLNIYANYKKMISFPIQYMTLYQIEDYINKIIKTQEELKKVATIFYNSAILTSPPTYKTSIENQFNLVLYEMKEDLINVSNLKNTKSLDSLDENYEYANIIMDKIQNNLNVLKDIIALSDKTILMGYKEFISDKLISKIDIMFAKLKQFYNNKQYIELIEYYNIEYKKNLIDFNFMYSLENYTELLSGIIEDEQNIDKLFMDAQLSKEIDSSMEYIQVFLIELIEEEKYKTIRVEIYKSLDNLYSYFIDDDIYDLTFLNNEKKLKKLYLDNILIKANYIYWYDQIINVIDRFNHIDKTLFSSGLLNSKVSEFNSYTLLEQIENLIMNQYRIIADINRMIQEGISNTYDKSIENTIETIDKFNIKFIEDFNKYQKLVENIEKIEASFKIDLEFNTKILKAKEEWDNLIESNNIRDIIPVSYSDIEIITGNIPFNVDFSARPEIIEFNSNDVVETTFKWYIDGNVIEGDKINYTFYREDNYKIECEMYYPDGRISTRRIELELGGPTNSQIVKESSLLYNPIKNINQPKLTYFDKELNIQRTIPLIIDGDLSPMIDEGNIKIALDDNDLLENKVGYIIMGYEGVIFAGQDFDTNQIFSDDFEFPNDNEFLFDFHVSDPVIGKSYLTIKNSKLVQYMIKLSPERINSVYEIDDASIFLDYSIEETEIINGDLILMKNISGRYMVFEIVEINENTNTELEEFYFEMNFKFYINIAINEYERSTFKPLTTNYVVPTLVFELDSKEIFNSLISRLEKIESLKLELDTNNDYEMAINIRNEIELLENENKNFFIFEELNHIMININQLKDSMVDFNSCIIDENNVDDCINIEEYAHKYRNEIDTYTTFDQLVNNITSVTFKDNIIHKKIILSYYQEEYELLSLLIDTFSYNNFNILYFKEKLSIILSNDIIFKNENNYNLFIYEVVELIRKRLYKLKLVTNMLIMSTKNNIVLTTPYLRYSTDTNDNIVSYEEDNMYLFYKKLELKYGYENLKLEEGEKLIDFLADIVSKSKKLFGKGLSEDEEDNLSNYINTLEDLLITEYDNFFMIPYWVDYLKQK